MNKILIAAAFGLAASIAAVAPAQATTTFADFHAKNSSANIQLVGLSLTSGAPIVFNFKTPLLALLGDLQAKLSLSAGETGAISFGPLALATFTGSFSFTYTGPSITAGGTTVNPGDNLLSGTFGDAVFTGSGSAASVIDSNASSSPTAFVSFSSDFLTFDPIGDENFGLALSSVSPPVSVVAGALTPFTGVVVGTFGADILTGGGGGTPEPATWALMLVGFGAIGAATRHRARTAVARA